MRAALPCRKGGARLVTLKNPIESTVCELLTTSPQQSDFPSGVSWDEVVTYARGQGVAPLLYWRLLQRDRLETIPADARQQLSQAYHAVSAQNTLLFNELGRIVWAFHQAGIPVILLKGAALAVSIYPNLATRPMSDLDLLIPRPLFLLAQHIAVEQLGYQDVRQQVTPQLEQLVDYHVHLRGGPMGQVDLELHWSLVTSEESWYAAPVGWFWGQTEPYPLEQIDTRLTEAGADVRMFTPAAQLLHLAGHAVLQHGIAHLQLLWLHDIHTLVEKESARIDWGDLAEQAHSLGWANALAEALAVTQACFATPLPDGLLDSLRSASEPGVAWLAGLKKRFPAARLMGDWYTLLSLRWPARFRYIFAMIFPRPAYIHWRYHPRPAWIWPLYYPYRWVRAAWDGTLAFLRLALRCA